jgi:hypothetical protein
MHGGSGQIPSTEGGPKEGAGSAEDIALFFLFFFAFFFAFFFTDGSQLTSLGDQQED